MKLKQYECTRNLQIWHDASTIANHSHILFAVNVLYDTAVFYTDKEYLQIYGNKVDVQSEIESPELYIIGRCKSSDEQLGYVDTRVECLQDLNIPITTDEGVTIYDKMRLFHGDGPAAQLEGGNQKGGHYFCPTCDVFLYQTDNITYSYQLKSNSLQEIQHKVISGKYGLINSNKGKLKPFAALSTKELHEELNSRKISTNATMKINLAKELKQHLKGTTRVPILLKNNPTSDLSSLNLQKYEIAMLEPMHDIGGHITNLFEELPHHLTKADKEKFDEAFEISHKQKETQRNCDKRKSLLTIIVTLDGKINNKAICLLKTLADIQRILYLNELKRNSQEILRLHNACFKHAILLKEVIGFNLKKITREKLYGKYMHNLIVHSPIQYRLINGQSINCEGEERFFNTIKQITGTTSSNRPGHIIGNIITRHQIESRCKESYNLNNENNQVNRDIQQLNEIIERYQYNTLFTYDYIKKNGAEWQSHLERISDFLYAEFGVEFLDKCRHEKYPQLPKVYHFRSITIPQIEQKLEGMWEKLINENIVMPIHQIYTENEDGKSISATNYLCPYIKDQTTILKGHSSENENEKKIEPEFEELDDNCLDIQEKKEDIPTDTDMNLEKEEAIDFECSSHCNQ